jgi:hypothetical protein
MVGCVTFTTTAGADCWTLKVFPGPSSLPFRDEFNYLDGHLLDGLCAGWRLNMTWKRKDVEACRFASLLKGPIARHSTTVAEIIWERKKEKESNAKGFLLPVDHIRRVCVFCVDVKVIFFFGSTAPDMAPVGGGENRRSRLRCLLEESALPRTQQSN